MEQKAKIADTKPIICSLDSDKNYYWCTCGESKNQPYCDGSHHGTEFQPLVFCLDEAKPKAALCTCKRTSNPPYCDGKHKNL